MISWILQKPWHVAAYGAGLTLLTAFVAIKLPELKKLWRIPQVTAPITVVLVIISLMIETEEEKIRRTLFEAAQAIEGGNYDALAEYIHPREEGLRRIAQAELSTYAINRVAIKSNLIVQIDHTKSPPRAIAKFNVVVQGSDPSSLIGTRNVPRYVILTYEKLGDEWKVIELSHYDPLTPMRSDDYRRRHGLPAH